MENNAIATVGEYQVLPYSSKESYELSLRMAGSLSQSTLVPEEFRGKDGAANCLIALELAARLKISPFACIQNMYVVHGRPSWSAQFIIGRVNSSGIFAGRLQFEYNKEGTACTAWAKARDTGEILRGETISIEMAKRAGWYDKGSQLWKSVPGQMLSYRAASFFARRYCPDVILGLYSSDEIYDSAVDASYDAGDPRPATRKEDKAEKSKRLTGEILGGEPEPVVDATLRPEPDPKKEEPEPEPEEPLSHPSEQREIYNQYLTLHGGDAQAAKTAIHVITGDKPSSKWTQRETDKLRENLRVHQALRADGDAKNAALDEAAAFL